MNYRRIWATAGSNNAEWQFYAENLATLFNEGYLKKKWFNTFYASFWITKLNTFEFWTLEKSNRDSQILLSKSEADPEIKLGGGNFRCGKFVCESLGS